MPFIFRESATPFIPQADGEKTDTNHGIARKKYIKESKKTQSQSGIRADVGSGSKILKSKNFVSDDMRNYWRLVFDVLYDSFIRADSERDMARTLLTTLFYAGYREVAAPAIDRMISTLHEVLKERAKKVVAGFVASQIIVDESDNYLAIIVRGLHRRWDGEETLARSRKLPNFGPTNSDGHAEQAIRYAKMRAMSIGGGKKRLENPNIEQIWLPLTPYYDSTHASLVETVLGSFLAWEG